LDCPSKISFITETSSTTDKNLLPSPTHRAKIDKPNDFFCGTDRQSQSRPTKEEAEGNIQPSPSKYRPQH